MVWSVSSGSGGRHGGQGVEAEDVHSVLRELRSRVVTEGRAIMRMRGDRVNERSHLPLQEGARPALVHDGEG